MSKLPPEIKATLSHQKEQLLDLIDQAKLLEFMLLQSFGENPETISTLDQLTEIAEQARDRLLNCQPSICLLPKYNQLSLPIC